MCARSGGGYALPSARTPEPRSKISSSPPQRTSTQGVFPPYRLVVAPGAGMDPRTPQNFTWKSPGRAWPARARRYREAGIAEARADLALDRPFSADVGFRV